MVRLFTHIPLFVALAGCSTASQQLAESTSFETVQQLREAVESEEQRAADAARSTAPPLSASALLTPPLTLMGAVEEPRFDISAQNLDARAFFMGLVDGTDYNMLVHPDISGQISLSLKQVTVEEVMQAMRQVYGYEYRRNGQLYQVLPAEMQTEIFQLNYLDIDRSGVSDTQVSAGSVRDSGSTGNINSNDTEINSNNSNGGSASSVVGTRINTKTSANFWLSLQQTLETIIGKKEGNHVVVSAQTGTVVVRAMPSELDTVRDYLAKSELILRRQVIIEARVLEITLNDDFQSGINWTALSYPSGSGFADLRQTANNLTNNTGLGGLFSLDLSFTDFRTVIQLLNQQGDVQVLSSPRVSTVNNQKAVIKVGTDEFYVTNVETTTTTGNATTTTPSVELTPFFSGIALDVTPQVSENGQIIMHVHPTVSEVRDQQKLIDLGSISYTIPLALSSIRESDSIVSAENGQVIVIGGLMKSSRENITDKMPLLGDLPGIGQLFSQQQRGGSKTELVILLRPVLADGQNMRQELDRSLNAFEGMRAN